MTTKYYDKDGKLLRTDKGTRPAGTPAPKPPPSRPQPTPATHKQQEK